MNCLPETAGVCVSKDTLVPLKVPLAPCKREGPLVLRETSVALGGLIPEEGYCGILVGALEEVHVLRLACQPVWVELRSAHMPGPFCLWAWNFQAVRILSGWGKMARCFPISQRSIITEAVVVVEVGPWLACQACPPWCSQWLPWHGFGKSCTAKLFS